MAQQSRALDVLSEDSSSVSSAHIEKFTMACNSSSSSGPLRHQHACIPTYTQARTYTHTQLYRKQIFIKDRSSVDIKAGLKRQSVYEIFDVSVKAPCSLIF